MKNAVIIMSLIISGLTIIIGCQETSKNKKQNVSENTPGKTQLAQNRIGNSNYYISIPRDYILKENEGPDFSVFYFYPADTTNQPPFAGGIYFGNFPTMFNPENDSCKVKDITIKFLDSLANWSVYECPGKYFVQTIAEIKDSADWSEKIHAFGNAKTKEGLNTVLEIFGTMKNKN